MAAFTFNESLHEYRVGAQLVPSCTAVIAEGGLVGYRFVAQELVERKSELGREAHRACHLDNLGKLGDCDPRVLPRLHAWREFKARVKRFKLLNSEFQTVAYLNGMAFGMKLDCQALLDGEEHIIEWKIGAVYPHTGVQLAGYAAGAPHTHYTSPMAKFIARKRIAVELRPNGVPLVHYFKERSDFDVFASLLHVASWKRRFEKIYKGEIA